MTERIFHNALVGLVLICFWVLSPAHAGFDVNGGSVETRSRHHVEFRVDLDIFPKGSFEFGTIDYSDQNVTLFDRKILGNKEIFSLEIKHGDSYHEDMLVFIDIIRLPRKFSIHRMIEKSPVRVHLPIRFRKFTNTRIGFDVNIPRRYGKESKDYLDELKTTDRALRSRIFEKYLASSIGYQHFHFKAPVKRRWARMRFDAILQLAKSFRSEDSIQIPRHIVEEYLGNGARADPSSVWGNFAVIAANYAVVDDAIIRSIGDEDCSKVKYIVKEVQHKNESNFGEDLVILNFESDHFEKLQQIVGCG
ncbi:MAG: hypothetical protein P1U37_00645 [Minwuia sp.]|nr:hypothetical protein [Minwuia sp.]